MKIDFSQYKFHCSSLGKVMTKSRTKDPLGETCKKHLIECYVESKYGRKKNIQNKYINKGLAVEESGITLYSRVSKKFFKKNTEQFENEWVIGTPDIVMLPAITDIKASWDLWSFYNVLAAAINPDYYWQCQGYMDLTGASEARLVYTLIDTPENLIQAEYRKLSWQMGVIDADANPLYIEGCNMIKFEMTFDDIPIEERFIELTIKRNQDHIGLFHTKVDLCRTFLNQLP